MTMLQTQRNNEIMPLVPLEAERSQEEEAELRRDIGRQASLIVLSTEHAAREHQEEAGE